MAYRQAYNINAPFFIFGVFEKRTDITISVIKSSSFRPGLRGLTAIAGEAKYLHKYL